MCGSILIVAFNDTTEQGALAVLTPGFGVDNSLHSDLDQSGGILPKDRERVYEALRVHSLPAPCPEEGLTCLSSRFFVLEDSSIDSAVHSYSLRNACC